MGASGSRYNASCCVIDPDTVVVQGMRFVKERTCKNVADSCVPFHCSECDCITLYDEERETGIMPGSGMMDAPNYCPNCGAKVVGDE